jgi:hypothetical protein
MNQPGESEIQVIAKKEKPSFAFFRKAKRGVAITLVKYMTEAMEEFRQNLRDEAPENLYIRSVSEEEIASLWWEGEVGDRIQRYRNKEGNEYILSLWYYGVYDATLLLPAGERNTADEYNLLNAIMRDCWEQRHKVAGQERRKKIKEMSPLMKEFYDGVDIEWVDY